MTHSNRVRLIGATVATSLVASLFPAVAVAQDANPAEGQKPALCTEYEGSFDWGVRASFRDYVVGKIARGTVEFNGQAVDKDQVKAPDYKFNFAAASVKATSNTAGEIALKGDVHFSGHKGQLDSRLSNLRLKIDGTKVEIVADVVGRDIEQEPAEPPAINKTGAVFAQYELPKAFDFTSKEAIALAGTPTVNDLSHEFFIGRYEVGSALDPATGTITCKKTDEQPKPGDDVKPKPGDDVKPKPGDDVKPTHAVPTTAPMVENPNAPTNAVPTTAPMVENPTLTTNNVPTTAPTLPEKPNAPTNSVPTTAPTVENKDFPTNLRDFLKSFAGNPITAILGLVSIGGLIAILTGIGGNLLNLFKR